MTTYLHIGVGKTGTTTLQVYLEENREALKSLGFWIPEAPRSRNHRALVKHALDDDVMDNTRRLSKLNSTEAIEGFRRQLEIDLDKEARQIPTGMNVIFTSEQLTRLRTPSEMDRLKSLVSLYGTDIKVVVYVRRQDQYYVSEYSQHIKGGNDYDMKPTEKLTQQPVYDYKAFLHPWATAFGKENILVRVFERSQMKNGDIIADFCELLNIEGYEGLKRPAKQNESLDRQTIMYLRKLNYFFPRTHDKKQNKRRHQLLRALEAISTGDKVRLNYDDARFVLDLFEDSNAYVAREYLGLSDGILFREPLEPKDSINPELDFETSFEITGKLLKKLL